MIWNTGIGPAASFLPTLTRLLFERTKDIYGPYDNITRVRLPPPCASAARSTSRDQEYRLAFDVLTQLARTLLETSLPEDVKQIAAEESYFGYSKLSDYLMLQAFGQNSILWIGLDYSIRSDPIFELQPVLSPIVERIREALEGKRHLLLVENLHVPVSLDVLVSTMGDRRPSVLNNRRWLISTTSKDVCEKSRGDKGYDFWVYHLTPEYYYAPSFSDLRERDWAVLIKEALLDAARSIYSTLEDKGYPVKFWLHVAQQCLYYGILYHKLQEDDGSKASNASSITSDELVRCWVAEDLLFSTTVSTNTQEATVKEQSNYYRSAYEAGKVVIEALHEYSLLPIYSVSTSTVSNSSPIDVNTGVSKLAGTVPRLRQDELNTHVKKSNQDGSHF
jgi:hypothetical protein